MLQGENFEKARSSPHFLLTPPSPPPHLLSSSFHNGIDVENHFMDKIKEKEWVK